MGHRPAAAPGDTIHDETGHGDTVDGDLVHRSSPSGVRPAHAEFQVPLGHRFIRWDLAYEAHQAQQEQFPGGGRFDSVTPAAYQRLRGPRAAGEPPSLPVPLAPRTVGRQEREVVFCAGIDGALPGRAAPVKGRAA